MALGNNPLIVPILNAPAHAFASEVDGGTPDSLVDAAEKGGEGLWAGSQLGVVTGFQARTGARIVWAGGVELFSDEYAQKEISKYVMFIFFGRILTIILLEELLQVTSNSRRMSLLGLSKSLLFCASTASSITEQMLRNPASNILRTISWCV